MTQGSMVLLPFLAAVYIYSTTISLIHLKMTGDPLAIINNKIYVANI